MARHRLHKLDANHRAMVRELRDVLGFAAVESIAHVRGGIGDIMVAHQGRNWLFEIKDPAKPPSARRLTPAERDFHERWTRAGGQIDVVMTTEDVLDRIGFVRIGGAS